ncbi:uncharacterized protein (TIGR02145 family) [Chryseobacterium sp. 7]|uniref:FISUMP domain-containing protein n=1 Tax=Chryseobacterium sp. 7 TaxID=2035214 RepID=UPI000EB0497F|nr:FISUMP domain-containing protein [Chryseobacterium sp. 7]RLJ22915.1 uncharacterized protein (TIGR02145 family) [Chryseobacterium sp. 7]
MKKRLLPLLFGLMGCVSLYGQVGVNTETPKATLEVRPKAIDGSISEGVICPRLTADALHQADINGVYSQDQDGTIAFVTSQPSAGNRVGQTIDIDSRGYYYYDYPANKWIKMLYGAPGAVVGSLDCAGATVSGSLVNGQPASGVTGSINYTGGNGGTYFGGAVGSTGVTGLTASIASGTINQGFGSLSYTITGTPSGAGNAIFPVNFGGKSCNLSIPVTNSSANVTVLNCAAATVSGSLTSGQPASGVTASIGYTGGNGGTYGGESVTSTGVTGLTATLNSGTISSSGNIIYSISGTPSSNGTASFTINFGGQSCVLSVNVGSALSIGSGSLVGKTCFDVVMVNDGGDCGTLSGRLSQKADFSQASTNVQTYTFTPTGTVSNVRFLYTNSNGQVINSISGGNSGNNITTSVNATVSYNTNLNTLASGTMRINALTAQIIVIYNDGASNNGTDRQLRLTVNVQDCACCGAYIAPGQWKGFMCHNLGADMSANALVASASIHGAKYQWGAQTNETGRYYSQAQDLSNSGTIAGWNSTDLPDNTWQDGVKTAKDPCPAGYRVPTQAQWQGILSYPSLNPITRIGSWASSATNYTTAIKFGNSLLLPAAGSRLFTSGALNGRGINGSYWSSTQYTSLYLYANYLNFDSSANLMNFYSRANGFSVRCISE